MAKTTTKDKTATEAPQQAPAAQLPAAPDEGGFTYARFQQELQSREHEIVSMLPPHVDPRKFNACAVAAIKQNPDLLKCSVRSLFGAITKSAQDGILPDGREGVITSYNTRISGKNGAPDLYIPMAQWNPMLYGLRKRARELDGMLVDAQVVYSNDRFLWHQGDDPKIEHEPAAFTERGEMIGAYAIFKREDGTILHREVMAKDQIMTVKEQSKAQNGLLWTKFETEGWRKTVVRRGIKAVPVSSKLEEIVRRDDDHFEFSAPQPETGVVEGQLIPPRPKQSDFAPKEPPPQKITHKSSKPNPEPAGDPRPDPEPVEGSSAPQSFSEPYDNELDGEPEDGITEEVIQEAPATSAAYDNAEKWINAAEESIAGEADLDDLQKKGRTVIDSFKGLSEEEGDALRGRFVTVILREKQRRQGRKR